MANEEGVLWLDTGNGSALSQLPDSEDMRVMAVDDRNLKLWAFGKDRLRSYDFDGNLLSDISITESDDEEEKDKKEKDEGGGDKKASLDVNTSDGTVWLAVKKTLYTFDTDGNLLNIVKHSKKIKSISIDTSNSHVWVATKKKLTAYGSDYGIITEFEPGKEAEIKKIYFDSDSQTLWVVNKKKLFSYDTAGNQLSEQKIKKLERITGDGGGGLWLATEEKIIKIDVYGSIEFELEEWGFDGSVADIAVDPSDRSLWIAGEEEIAHISPDGEILFSKEFEDLRAIAFYADIIPPELEITSPADGSYVNDSFPEIGFSYSDVGSGINYDTLTIYVEGSVISADCVFYSESALCTPRTALDEGEINVYALIEDNAGNTSSRAAVTFVVDTVAPVISLTSPTDGTVQNVAEISISGQVSEPAQLTLTLTKTKGAVVEEYDVPVGDAGEFNFGPVTMAEGDNDFVLTAVDYAGNAGSLNFGVTLDTVAPVEVDGASVTVSDVANGIVTVSGGLNSAEPGSYVTITNNRTGESVTVQVNADGSFSAEIAAEPGDTLTIVTSDSAGNNSLPVDVNAPASNALPPDPSTVAPAIDMTVATSMKSATEFLYTGANPIQTGVDPAAIEAKRVAVLRGKVMMSDGQPLSGVTVTIPNHPEYGQTLSRSDGMFDMAVNGGGSITVEYAKDGYLPVQRNVNAQWRDFSWLPEVVMIMVDSQVTAVSANSAVMQVAQGSTVTDADGTRQATILFPPGTMATMTLPDGTTQQLSTLNVRATEFTVGANGPKAMPAPLPPTSAYTYAVEFSVDEAIAAGAKTVTFNQPVYVHVDNFLGFLPGDIVPVGFYDYDAAAWVSSDNGLTIEILSVTGGLADVDVDGSGIAADAASLAGLGFTDEERQNLASLYQQGKTLWRAPISHFSTADFNFPVKAKDPSPDPKNPDPEKKQNKKTPGDPCDKGSIISCQTQTLREAVAVTGTPFSLVYNTARVEGFTAAGQARITLTGDTISTGTLDSITLEVYVAGQKLIYEYAPEVNLVHDLQWNGRDAYGRLVQGETPVEIRIGYNYLATYAVVTGTLGDAWADYADSTETRGSARKTVTKWQESEMSAMGGGSGGLGNLKSKDSNARLGAWTLTNHHIYDVYGYTLHKGDGTKRSPEDVGSLVMDTVAGTGTQGTTSIPDGISATDANIYGTSGIAFAPDGSYYFATTRNVIYKVDPDGVLHHYAGTGTQGYSGDGGQATSAMLNQPRGLDVGSDGSLYIADRFNNRIRRVNVDGTIETVAGTGTRGFSGDNGLATDAVLNIPSGLAVADDGSIYIADAGNKRIRLVDTKGNISTIKSYTNTSGQDITAIALGPDGSLYYAAGSNNTYLYRITPDGATETVAGSGCAYRYRGMCFTEFSGDGGDALLARFNWIMDVEVSSDGSIYVLDAENMRVRRINSDGIVTTVAGAGCTSYYGRYNNQCLGGDTGDGGPALQAYLSAYYTSYPSIALSPDGDLYITDTGNYKIRKVSSALPGYTVGDIVIPSENGNVVYIFDSSGRHQSTKNALTGSIIHEFAYDANGYLDTITDGDGNVTTIKRDIDGNPTAIIAPDGQRTDFTLDANGYMDSITDPLGNAYQAAYNADGLMQSFTDPNGNASTLTYDADGRLLTDLNAGGGGWSITRAEFDGGHTVTMSTAEGRAKTYTVEELSTGGKTQTDTDPSGLVRITEYGTDAVITATSPSGTVSTSTQSGDPRWGMMAPYTSYSDITLPSGLASVTETQRTATLTDPADIMSLSTQTDTITVNGRVYTSQYDASTLMLTATSPEGRQTFTTLDAKGKVTNEQIPNIYSTDYAYDTRGRLSTVTQGTGTVDERLYSFTYNAQGYLSQITDPLSRAVNFFYDAAGRLTTQVLADGRQISYTYDSAGNVTSITPPGRPSHSFAYNAFNLESDYTPPDIGIGTVATQYTYNLDKQLDLITRPDGNVIDFVYDSGGNLATMTLPRGSYSYAYDATSGTLSTITAPDGGAISYTYDGSLLLTTSWTGSVSGSVERTFDNNFWITQRSVNGGNAVNFSHNNDGQLITAGALGMTYDANNGFLSGTSMGGVTDNITYDSFGDTASYGASYNNLAKYSVTYTRDSLGRITQKAETVEGTTNTFDYLYDAAGRLVEVLKNGISISQYIYDDNGNRTSKVTTTGVEYGSYDNQDRMVSYGDATYTYNANGELLSKTDTAGTTSYNYDVLGNLISASLPDGTFIEYVIDANNRRIGKKVNGTLVQGFLYKDHLNPIAELDGSGNVVSRFVYATRSNVPDFMIKNGTTYRIISDHLGSPRLVIDVSTGSIAQKLEYDEFGNVTTDTSYGFQPFGFAGGIYDLDTGLTRFGARDYDPVSGRWTSKDPIRFDDGDTNFYGYVLNDPVNYFDSFGLWEIDLGISGGVNNAGVNVGVKINSSGIYGYYGFGLGGGAGATAAITTGTTSEGVAVNSTARAGDGWGAIGSVSVDQDGNVNPSAGIGLGIGWGFATTATYTTGWTWEDVWETFIKPKRCSWF